MADFEVSGMNLKGLLDALDARGLREQVVAQVSQEVQAACAEPMRRKWYPSAVTVEIWTALVRIGGPQLLEDVSFGIVRRAYGPVVGPLVKVALALSSSSPAALFSQFGRFTSLALRNVQFNWESTGANSGIVTVRYPRPMPQEIAEPAWRGIFRIGPELTGKDIRVEQCVARTDENAFEFHVGW